MGLHPAHARQTMCHHTCHRCRHMHLSESPSPPPATVAANLQLQEDELCALQSIYGEDALAATDARSWRTAVPAPDGPHLVLAFHLPESYPSAAPPLFQLDSSYLPGDVSEQLATELEAVFLPGGEGGEGRLHGHPARQLLVRTLLLLLLASGLAV